MSRLDDAKEKYPNIDWNIWKKAGGIEAILKNKTILSTLEKQMTTEFPKIK